MIEIDPSRFKSKPFAHQLEGVRKLVQFPSFALYDEMGAGKSKQVVDAACVLAAAGKIDTVVVITPASVRRVWLNEEMGEIKKHAWLRSAVYDFHAKVKAAWCDVGNWEIAWLVTNYELLRQDKHLERLMEAIAGRKVLLVLDESSYVKSRTAAQTKAALKLRSVCARCVLLNGTPITNNPLDLWAQFLVLDKAILQKRFHNYFFFRSEFAELGGWHNKQVIRWKRLDHLQKLLAPFVLRRLKKDCLDLPPKLFTQREVPLSSDTWARYKELRDECIISLGTDDRLVEPNTASRVLRLCQLTSGHVGHLPPPPPGWDPATATAEELAALVGNTASMITDLSTEKIDWAVRYITEESTAPAIIVWCRWRRERERLFAALVPFVGKIRAFQLFGGQSKDLREEAVREFGTSYTGLGRLVLLAQPQAGGLGLTLVAATEVVYLSNDWNLGVRLQSEDRCHRLGQAHPVTYVDVIATGPKGQKTVDSVVVKALRTKQDLAALTTAGWRRALKED